MALLALFALLVGVNVVLTLSIGCTGYTHEQLALMDCKNVTMRRGDALYLPRGTVHVAETRDRTSVHVTYQLKVDGLTWADWLLGQCADMCDVTSVCESLSQDLVQHGSHINGTWLWKVRTEYPTRTEEATRMLDNVFEQCQHASYSANLLREVEDSFSAVLK